MNHIVYLALGSNLGDRLNNLRMVVSNLTPQMSLKAKSPVYETPPWGYADQGAFLNQVVKVETYMAATSLIKHLKRLETALGRTPGFENGPRVIDVDILFYDNEIINTPPLVIPHPRLHERAFVLVPLADIAPDFIHPVLNKTVKQLLADVDSKNIKAFE